MAGHLAGGTVQGARSSMREWYSRDLETLLHIQLDGNERVRALVTAYEELAEEEKILFRLAAGMSQDSAGRKSESGRRPNSERSGRNQPDRVQPFVQNLMKTLLEDHASLLTETDISNLMDRDYCQKTLGLQIGGFPLLRRREAGRSGSDSDGHDRFYYKLYAGRFYLCSQWWRDYHLSNARSLLRFIGEIANRDPGHPGIPDLEHHMEVLRDYIDRNSQ